MVKQAPLYTVHLDIMAGPGTKFLTIDTLTRTISLVDEVLVCDAMTGCAKQATSVLIHMYML